MTESIEDDDDETIELLELPADLKIYRNYYEHEILDVDMDTDISTESTTDSSFSSSSASPDLVVVRYSLKTQENRWWISKQLEDALLLKKFLTQGSFHAPCGKHVLLLLVGSEKGGGGGDGRRKRQDSKDDGSGSRADPELCSLIDGILNLILSENDMFSGCAATRSTVKGLAAISDEASKTRCRLNGKPDCGGNGAARCWDLVYDSCCTCVGGTYREDCRPINPCIDHECRNGGKCEVWLMSWWSLEMRLHLTFVLY